MCAGRGAAAQATSDPGKYPYAFVRRRTRSGGSSYGYTSVDMGPDGQKIELKRIISQREYKVGGCVL